MILSKVKLYLIAFNQNKNIKMKNLLTMLMIGTSIIITAQVRIGAVNSATTVTNNTSVLLEFGTDGDKGIILPYVETLPTGANNSKGGTIIFDVSASTEYKVKVKNENTGWSDLSGVSGFSAAVESDVKTPQASPLTEQASAKVIIGNSATTTDGVLVLESDSKAIVLPIVTDFTAIKNPSPGMMAFLKGATTDKNRLIVFNGQKWSFWKP